MGSISAMVNFRAADPPALFMGQNCRSSYVSDMFNCSSSIVFTGFSFLKSSVFQLVMVRLFEWLPLRSKVNVTMTLVEQDFLSSLSRLSLAASSPSSFGIFVYHEHTSIKTKYAPLRTV